MRAKRKFGLTRRQRKILDFVAAYRERRGISPAHHEIAKAIGVSTPTINWHVRRLVEMGMLRRAALNRGLVVVDGAPKKRRHATP